MITPNITSIVFYVIIINQPRALARIQQGYEFRAQGLVGGGGG